MPDSKRRWMKRKGSQPKAKDRTTSGKDRKLGFWGEICDCPSRCGGGENNKANVPTKSGDRGRDFSKAIIEMPNWEAKRFWGEAPPMSKGPMGGKYMKEEQM